MKKIIALVRLWHIRRKAQRLADTYHCQLFVVKYRGRPLYLTKSQFKYLRARGIFPKSFTAVDLRDCSLFVASPKS